MADNELPKDMGKKIADALKKQSGENFETEQDGDFELNAADSYGNNENFEAEENYGDTYGNNSYELNMDGAGTDFGAIFNVDSSEINENPELKLSIEDEEETEEEFEMPNNINVLKRLIAQLPTGVPRHTGAQIIRQTIEALGIPMKSVLQDAQRVRECLNSSIKDCSYTISEYKSNIKNLEKQSAGYQKQLSRLNDIIGLFIYSEKSK